MLTCPETGHLVTVRVFFADAARGLAIRLTLRGYSPVFRRAVNPQAALSVWMVTRITARRYPAMKARILKLFVAAAAVLAWSIAGLAGSAQAASVSARRRSAGLSLG